MGDLAKETQIKIIEDGATRLDEIDNDRKLKLTLKGWVDDFKVTLSSIENKRSRGYNVKNELYQITGFYIVFQGVVLTAVSQASTLKCHTSWGPASLSLLVSIATVISIHYKLKDYRDLKKKLNDEVVESRSIKTKIDLLKRKGSGFEFSILPFREARSSQLDMGKKFTRNKHYWFVMVFLILFSIVILSSCFTILCWKRG